MPPPAPAPTAATTQPAARTSAAPAPTSVQWLISLLSTGANIPASAAPRLRAAPTAAAGSRGGGGEHGDGARGVGSIAGPISATRLWLSSWRGPLGKTRGGLTARSARGRRARGG